MASFASDNLFLFSGLFSNQWRGRRYLFSPVFDFLMVGGAALIMLAYTYANWEDANGQKIYTLSQSYIVLFFLLSLVVNYPHFMMSYQILYTNFGGKLRRFRQMPAMFWRYIITGIVVPIVLIAALGWSAYVAAVDKYLIPSGVAILAMLFFVGWHYIKQSFGVFMMLSALKAIYYTKFERFVLLLNSYVLWIGSFIFSWGMLNTYSLNVVFNPTRDAIPLIYVRLPEYMLNWIFYVLIASGVLVICVIIRSAIRQKKRPSITALIGYTSMYYLFASVTWGPMAFAYAAPFFHSLQYLMFAMAFRRGQYSKELEQAGAGPSNIRPAINFFVFVLMALLLGKLGFYYFPIFVDTYFYQNYSGLFPVNYFVMIFTVFINIHHYFVDNVIWRKENTEVGEYLLGVKPI